MVTVAVITNIERKMPNFKSVCAQHTGPNTPEVKSLKEGEYVGVRRFTRILERGTEAKSELDKVIDRCGGLVNLRTAIMRYRKPRRWFRFYRCRALHFSR